MLVTVHARREERILLHARLPHPVEERVQPRHLIVGMEGEGEGEQDESSEKRESRFHAAIVPPGCGPGFSPAGVGSKPNYIRRLPSAEQR